jgi:hypothetical protein
MVMPPALQPSTVSTTWRRPFIRLNEFLSDTQEIGQGVVVNQGNWQQQLENNKQAFTLEFVQRSRFTTAFPTSLTPAQFVDMMFANAGVTPSSADRTTAINEFGGAVNTSDVGARSRAVRDVAENATLNQQEFNRAFVLMQYLGYLRRNPNDVPDADYTGYDFWLTKLNQFNGNYINADPGGRQSRRRSSSPAWSNGNRHSDGGAAKAHDGACRKVEHQC